MRLIRSLFGPGGGAPVVRVPRRQPRVVELEDEGAFALLMQQSEEIRRNAPLRGERRQVVQVVIQLTHDPPKSMRRVWEDAEVFFASYWRPGIEGGLPRPTEEDLREAARRAGALAARSVIRADPIS